MKYINIIDDQEPHIYTHLSRRSLIKLFGLSAIGMGLWISACDHSGADSAPSAEIKEGKKMESAKLNIKTRIPAIDAAAPAETSTATFALG